MAHRSIRVISRVSATVSQLPIFPKNGDCSWASEAKLVGDWQRSSVAAGTAGGVAAAFFARLAAPFFAVFREAFTGAFFAAFLAAGACWALAAAFAAAFFAAQRFFKAATIAALPAVEAVRDTRPPFEITDPLLPVKAERLFLARFKELTTPQSGLGGK